MIIFTLPYTIVGLYMVLTGRVPDYILGPDYGFEPGKGRLLGLILLVPGVVLLSTQELTLANLGVLLLALLLLIIAARQMAFRRVFDSPAEAQAARYASRAMFAALISFILPLFVVCIPYVLFLAVRILQLQREHDLPRTYLLRARIAIVIASGFVVLWGVFYFTFFNRFFG